MARHGMGPPGSPGWSCRSRRTGRGQPAGGDGGETVLSFAAGRSAALRALVPGEGVAGDGLAAWRMTRGGNQGRVLRPVHRPPVRPPDPTITQRFGCSEMVYRV